MKLHPHGGAWRFWGRTGVLCETTPSLVYRVKSSPRFRG